MAVVAASEVHQMEPRVACKVAAAMVLALVVLAAGVRGVVAMARAAAATEAAT